MADDDNIPVLTDAVSRKDAGLSDSQIDELCDGLAAEAWVLIDNLVESALEWISHAYKIKTNTANRNTTRKAESGLLLLLPSVPISSS